MLELVSVPITVHQPTQLSSSSGQEWGQALFCALYTDADAAGSVPGLYKAHMWAAVLTDGCVAAGRLAGWQLQDGTAVGSLETDVVLLVQCQGHGVVLTVCCAACSCVVLFPYFAAVLFVRGTSAEPCAAGGTTAGQGGQHVRHAAEGTGGSPQGEQKYTQRRTENYEVPPPQRIESFTCLLPVQHAQLA